MSKSVQYADDTVIFVDSLRSMRYAMKEIDSFGKFHDENPSLACKNPYFIFTTARLMRWQ